MFTYKYIRDRLQVIKTDINKYLDQKFKNYSKFAKQNN